MSLKDLLSLADDKLADVFSRKPFDAEKARLKHIKNLDLTKDQFGRTEPVRGRKSWKAANNVVEYQSAFPIGGKTTHYVPSERFGEWIDKLKALVTGGTFDSDFAAAESDTSAKPARAARAPRVPGESGKGWSEERKAKFAATIAARKAAKG